MATKRFTSLATRERQEHALELRKAGFTYGDIAKKLGYAYAGGARTAAKAALKRIEVEEPEDEHLLDLVRYDRLLRAIWLKAVEGDASAIDRALKIMQARERLSAVIDAQAWAQKQSANSEELEDEPDSIAKVYAILADVGVLPAGVVCAFQAEDD